MSNKVLSHDNSFDVIRLLSALLVLFSHHFALSGFKEPSIIGLSLGRIAVIIFFGISGYLITQSAVRTNGFKGFIKKRALRIFPALFLCAFFIYFVLGFFLQPSMVLSFPTIKSFIRLILLRGADPMSMADGFIYPNAINGSLWTLFMEFSCYVILGGLVYFLGGRKSIYFVSLVFFLLLFVFSYVEVSSNFLPIGLERFIPFATSFIPFATSFFCGSIIYLNNHHVLSRKVFLYFIASSFILFFIFFNTRLISVLAYLYIPFFTILTGNLIKENIISGRFDYSYGIYIYAFPVQQIIINYTNFGFYKGMMLSIFITFILASLSWNLVEKRFIYKNKSIP
ncbi:TPA: acyltransferase family protein [Klebsiella variicola subsp. variicola]